MEGININEYEKSSQGCYKAIQIGFCDSYHNNIIDIQNSLKQNVTAASTW